jgi:exoribonuclease-2
MLERGLEPDFGKDVRREVAQLTAPAAADGDVRDLRTLLWASIDNDDSRDLDQLTVAEALSDNRVRILVAIADVDALVKKGSAIDGHAEHNTTSVYTASTIFPMLPEALSTGLTSLNEDQDRLAVVVDMVFEADGALVSSDHYRAHVRNQAKLAYRSVAAWLDGDGEAPPRLADVSGLGENLRVQDRVAQKLAEARHRQGALSLESLEAKAVFADDSIADLVADKKNRARQIIEDFMIAANGATAAFLERQGFPSLRRVLRSPRAVESHRGVGGALRRDAPHGPRRRRARAFLTVRRAAKPETFPDLSLSVIKLIGRGEYVLDPPGASRRGISVSPSGTTRTRRRRTGVPGLDHPASVEGGDLEGAAPLLHAGAGAPRRALHEEGGRRDQSRAARREIRCRAASHRTAGRVLRRHRHRRVGQGNVGRVFHPPVEGRLERGQAGLDVGDKVRVTLIHTDVELGYIDFARA